MFSPYYGMNATNWQYTMYEIVRFHRQEWFHLASVCKSYVTGSVYQEGNFWTSNEYRNTFQEMRQPSYENRVVPCNSVVGIFFNENTSTNQHQIEDRNEKAAVEPVIKLFMRNRFFYLPLQNNNRTYGFHPQHLKALAEEYPKYFEKYGNLLYFKPKIELCEAFSLGEGCNTNEICCNIHLCIYFLLDTCHDHNCKLGHNWKTDHNLRVFRNFHMNVNSVSQNYLKALLTDKLISFKSPIKLQLCNNYDARGCTDIKCLKLHICFKYLMTQFDGNFSQNSCDTDNVFPKCMKNHDIKSNHNKKILTIHKLNFNDRPRNLIKVINNLVCFKNTYIFPAHWRKMYGMELFMRIPLDPFSEEYQRIKNNYNSEKLLYDIVGIERVQNPFLWKAFHNKVEEMTVIYRSEEYVNIKQLYHGTKEHLLNKICAENFDWRLHGCNVGAQYGNGAYFSPYAGIATNYCDKSANHQFRYIFLVRVAVGQMCKGEPKMTLPPKLPFVNRAFDSTCDQLVNPRRIVKYDKQEYYPEYILTITKSIKLRHICATSY